MPPNLSSVTVSGSCNTLHPMHMHISQPQVYLHVLSAGTQESSSAVGPACLLQ